VVKYESSQPHEYCTPLSKKVPLRRDISILGASDSSTGGRPPKGIRTVLKAIASQINVWPSLHVGKAEGLVIVGVH